MILIALPFMLSYSIITPKVPNAPASYFKTLNESFKEMPAVVFYQVESFFVGTPQNVGDRICNDYNVFSTLSTLKLVDSQRPVVEYGTEYNSVGQPTYINQSVMVQSRTDRGAALLHNFNTGASIGITCCSNSSNRSYYLTVRHQESTHYPPYTRFFFTTGIARLKCYYENAGCTNCNTEQELLDAMRNDLEFKVDNSYFPNRLTPEEMNRWIGNTANF